jgi:asparaginyl-tRNA synthetase
METSLVLKKQISNIFKDYDVWVKANPDSTYNVKETISGWVRDFRLQTPNAFIGLSDGSSPHALQVFVSKSTIPDFDNLENLRGACIQVSGFVVKSPAQGQTIELVAEEIKTLSTIQDKKHILLTKSANLETLRNHQHYRSRFRSYNYIYKIRSNLLKNIHEFFHANNFYNLDPNVITTSDCEGAGEVFTITSLDLTKKISEPKEESKEESIFANDFFSKQAFLTVSSQLQLEALTMGLSRVYTLNPSFRAEKSKTKRHLGCFTHLEWEIAFIDMSDLMNFSEALIKYVISKTLEQCADEYKELDKFLSKGIVQKLNSFVNCDFERISYDKAIELIEQNKKAILKQWKELDYKQIPKWGDDLGSYCERYICETIYKKPTFVYNYPKDLKSFYMKVNPDNKTCQGVDLIIPQLGELIGSSIRESSYEKLVAQMEARSMDKTKLQWYLDLRASGNAPTGGAGLGFDRLVNVCTLMDGNIRDVVPFPVSYQECDY